ncbi:hypothetical protein HN51_005985 [Arachis hypogaea]
MIAPVGIMLAKSELFHAFITAKQNTVVRSVLKLRLSSWGFQSPFSVMSCRTQVFMIVVTDGSRFLGLGGLGVHGTGIAIRKLDMYVVAVTINPHMI